MLESLVIKNYKRFVELDLQNFSRVNIFVGKNNSGKSTILEAINFALAESPFDCFNRATRRDLTKPSEMGREISYLFNDIDKSSDFEFYYNQLQHNVFIHSNSRGQISTASITTSVSNTSIMLLGKYIYDSQSIDLFLDRNSNNYTLSKNIVEKSLGPLNYFNTNLPWEHRVFQHVQLNKREYLILEFLRKIDNQIINLSLSNDEIYVDIGKPSLIPLRYLGDGVVKIVGVLTWLIVSESGVLLIDEIENGIYYKNVLNLIEHINDLSIQLNVQLFITTHSEDFIRRLSGFSDLSFYRLNPKFNGGVMRWDREKVVQYTNDDSIDIR